MKESQQSESKKVFATPEEQRVLEEFVAKINNRKKELEENFLLLNKQGEYVYERLVLHEVNLWDDFTKTDERKTYNSKTENEIKSRMRIIIGGILENGIKCEGQPNFVDHEFYNNFGGGIVKYNNFHVVTYNGEGTFHRLFLNGEKIYQT